MKTIINDIINSATFWVPALAGGVVDYFNQVQKGSKTMSISSFVIHIVSATFFGWFCGTVAFWFDGSNHLVAAASGAGGYLGVRVADLAAYKFIGDRRK